MNKYAWIALDGVFRVSHYLWDSWDPTYREGYWTEAINESDVTLALLSGNYYNGYLKIDEDNPDEWPDGLLGRDLIEHKWYVWRKVKYGDN